MLRVLVEKYSCHFLRRWHSCAFLGVYIHEALLRFVMNWCVSNLNRPTSECDLHFMGPKLFCCDPTRVWTYNLLFRRPVVTKSFVAIPLGFEPRISGFVEHCLIHWDTLLMNSCENWKFINGYASLLGACHYIAINITGLCSHRY